MKGIKKILLFLLFSTAAAVGVYADQAQDIMKALGFGGEVPSQSKNTNTKNTTKTQANGVAKSTAVPSNNGITTQTTVPSNTQINQNKTNSITSLKLSNNSQQNNLYLLQATNNNDIVAIQNLLEAGSVLKRSINVNTQDVRGRTPLFIASKNGNAALVSYLLKHGADPSIRDNTGDGALHVAVKLGYSSVVQAIIDAFPNLEKEKQNEQSDIANNKNTQIAPVSNSEKSKDRMASFVRDGVVNLKNNQGDTPLILAAKLNYPSIVKLLIAANADPNVKNNNGYTALMFASSNGSGGIVSDLIKDAVESDQQDNQGNTALIFASYKGYARIVQLLLKAGSNPNLKNDAGNTALIVSSREGYGNIVSDILNDKVYSVGNSSLSLSPTTGNNSSILRIGGVDTDIKNNKGETPLIVASQKGYSGIVNLLMNAGAKVNLKDNSGLNALLWASFNGYSDVVDVLVNSPDLQINMRDSHGNTPLILASAQNYIDVARILLSHGASVYIQNDDGISAIDLARSRKFTEMSKMLVFSQYQQDNSSFVANPSKTTFSTTTRQNPANQSKTTNKSVTSTTGTNTNSGVNNSGLTSDLGLGNINLPGAGNTNSGKKSSSKTDKNGVSFY